jgi:hypothetical protein
MNVSRRCVGVVAAVVMLAPLAGCKSGTSFAKPSWWTFGGTGPADAEKLATAPPYGEAGKTTDGAIPKPSAAATPYPTTTTPNGYVVTGSASAPPAVAAAAVGEAPITYGKTLPPAPPATAPAASLAPATAAPAAVAAAPPVAAQAGPYATIPAPPPPAAAATAPVTQPPDRYADARGFEPSAPAAATVPAAAAFGGPTPSEAAATDARYGNVTGSRFSGDASGGLLPVPSTTPSYGTGAAPAAAPSAPATSLPTMPPTRRPDPGYRPGGTSSYRPSKTILVGEPAAESAVRTAAFETPVQPVRQ